MAGYTRTNGANARSQGWDENEEKGTRSNWLPLENLADEELFASTPRLQSIRPTRAATVAQPRVEQPLKKTAPQRTTIRPASVAADEARQSSPASKVSRGLEARGSL